MPDPVEMLMDHQGPEFIDGKGTVECFCGEDVGNDHSWALHVIGALREAGYTVVPPSITRVDVIDLPGRSGRREYWADSWELAVLDEGRTLKLFAQGFGRDAKALRDAALAAELSADAAEVGDA